MKLLFDQNLAPRLVDRLADVYPDAEHVHRIGLDRASDEMIWDYARANGYTIVTRDVDFSELSIVRGFPPKVVWIRTGNCTTQHIEAVLRTQHEAVKAAGGDPHTRVFVLI